MRIRAQLPMRARTPRLLAPCRDLSHALEAHCSEVVADGLLPRNNEVRKGLASSPAREKLDR